MLDIVVGLEVEVRLPARQRLDGDLHDESEEKTCRRENLPEQSRGVARGRLRSAVEGGEVMVEGLVLGWWVEIRGGCGLRVEWAMVGGGKFFASDWWSAKSRFEDRAENLDDE